ncbi:MAG: hypothetical protein MK082_12240 [Phycisphaerales bacterium]|nr:hypothetical protein [Phycisphaerales bacterium]
MLLHQNRTRLIALAATCLAAGVSAALQAQHAGDIGLQVTDDQLEVFGPIGSPDTEGVFLGTFGDTGFPGYTSNPGFDAAPGTLPQGRVGFMALAGLGRWDPVEGIWLDPLEVDERLSISFITLETIVADEPVAGFDLAVQPDGGWHRHVNFELMPDEDGIRLPGVYRLDLALYSTMGLAESEPFTILFDYEADPQDVTDAIASMYEDACTGDLDGDGSISGADLSVLLGEWGTEGVFADLNEDGVVDGQDLTVLLGGWGPCPD